MLLFIFLEILLVLLVIAIFMFLSDPTKGNEATGVGSILICLALGIIFSLTVFHYRALNNGDHFIVSEIKIDNNYITYKSYFDKYMIRETRDPKKFKVGDTLWLNK